MNHFPPNFHPFLNSPDVAAMPWRWLKTAIGCQEVAEIEADGAARTTRQMGRESARGGNGHKTYYVDTVGRPVGAHGAETDHDKYPFTCIELIWSPMDRGF